MSKPKVVIHIGPMKTGTTALGYYFSTATVQGALPNNVLYPTDDLWFPPAGNITKHSALFDFIAERWDEYGADVKLNLPIGTVRQHMDNNDGKLPPGMTNSFYKRLNLRRT